MGTKEISFIIEGQPVGKGRPRFSRMKNGNVMSYTPEKTRSYEKEVKAIYCKTSLEKYHTILHFDENDAISVKIDAYFKIPKNTSKKVKGMMLENILRPLKKGDADNIAKIICDSLNDVAYCDDKQVVDLNVKKWYAENPRVEVTILCLNPIKNEETRDIN